MAAGIGQKIEAGDYNAIQNKVAGILGTGSGQSGYGQTVTSGQVIAGNKIFLSEWLNLRSDLRLARQHQTGVDESANLTIPATTLVITEALRSQYATYAQTIETNKFAIGAGQFSTETVLSYNKSGAWNGTISNVVTITGSTSGGGSVANMRYFFNAGGSFRISASRAGGSAGSKDDTWTTMLSQSGTVNLNYTTTTYDGSNGTVYNIGYYSLTTSDQLIFSKPAPAGNYAENDYFIYARKSADGSQVIFTMTFQDDDTGDQQGGFLPGPSVDENVNTVGGSTLNTTVSMNRPSGSNVSILAPTSSQTGM
jgi:hypothetical protein